MVRPARRAARRRARRSRGDLEVDVAIVGAGLHRAVDRVLPAGAPTRRCAIAVLESEIAGFGASGRNGGWCSALFPVSAGDAGRARPATTRRVAQYRAMRDSVAEVVRVAARRGHRRRHRDGRHDRARPLRSRSSTGRATRSPRRAEFGLGVAAARRATPPAPGWRPPTCLGATYTPHCAALQPAKLVRGLADGRRAARRATCTSTRRSPRVEPHAVHTAHGTVRARFVVRATEGYTARLPGQRRGRRAGVLADHRHRAAARRDVGRDRAARARDVQRPPAPDRLRPAQRRRPAWSSAAAARRTTSGRGSRPTYDRVPRGVRRAATRRCVELFPVLRGRRDHAPLGRPARHRPRLARLGRPRRGTGLAWAGGYVGDGVSTTNLAGRTLADLITGRDTELTALPWVGHRSRALGARAAALARRQRRAAGDDVGRPRRAAPRPAVARWPRAVNAMMGR